MHWFQYSQNAWKLERKALELITRTEAFQLIRNTLDADNLIYHSLATESIMRSLAERKGKDPELWGISGLLHDLDFEETKDHPEKHGLITAMLLEGRLPEEALQAIKSHNAEHNGTSRECDFDHLLAAAESVTGLISATALIYPERKLAPVKPRSVIKRMTKSGFARAVNRDAIRECTLAGFEVEEFIHLALDSMKSIAENIGL